MSAYRMILIAGIMFFLPSTSLFAQQEAVTLEAVSEKVNEISKKIDQLAQSQEEIIKRLEDIRAELDIVKIRARRG